MSREYDYHPKPLIEEHYHIKELFENQDKRVTERTYYRERAKNLEEREDDINKAPQFALLPFWCEDCKKEFIAQAILEVEEDWSNPSQRIAHYKTKCFKGHWLKRMLTDRWLDTYFFRSRIIAKDRQEHHNDILQPFETGYTMLYGKK